MILAVLVPVCAAQKHLSAAACQRSKAQKRGKVFTWRLSAVPPLKAKRILLLKRRKCPPTAKVRLEPDFSSAHDDSDVGQACSLRPVFNRPSAVNDITS